MGHLRLSQVWLVEERINRNGMLDCDIAHVASTEKKAIEWMRLYGNEECSEDGFFAVIPFKVDENCSIEAMSMGRTKLYDRLGNSIKAGAHA